MHDTNRSKLAENIQQLRLQKGMTQATLAHAVGVTPQAVSKWEHGCFPDAEILPRISDALGVSIDDLYGRKINTSKDIVHIITETIQSVSVGERMKTADSLIWACILGVSGNNSFSEAFHQLDDFSAGTDGDYLMRSLQKTGLIIGDLTSNHHYFMLAPQQEDSYQERIPKLIEAEQFFRMLADPDTLSIIYYFFHRQQGAVVTEQAIATGCRLSSAKVDHAIQSLLKYGIIQETAIEGDQVSLRAFHMEQAELLIGMLLIAKNIIANDRCIINGVIDSSGPADPIL